MLLLLAVRYGSYNLEAAIEIFPEIKFVGVH